MSTPKAANMHRKSPSFAPRRGLGRQYFCGVAIAGLLALGCGKKASQPAASAADESQAQAKPAADAGSSQDTKDGDAAMALVTAQIRELKDPIQRCFIESFAEDQEFHLKLSLKLPLVQPSEKHPNPGAAAELLGGKEASAEKFGRCLTKSLKKMKLPLERPGDKWVGMDMDLKATLSEGDDPKPPPAGAAGGSQEPTAELAGCGVRRGREGQQ